MNDSIASTAECYRPFASNDSSNGSSVSSNIFPMHTAMWNRTRAIFVTTILKIHLNILLTPRKPTKKAMLQYISSVFGFYFLHIHFKWGEKNSDSSKLPASVKLIVFVAVKLNVCWSVLLSAIMPLFVCTKVAIF